MGVILFFALLIAYLTAGLFISRAWYRRQRNPDEDDAMAAFAIIILWPAFLAVHHGAKAIRRFYLGPEDA